MPIDASIALGVKPVQIEDSSNALAKLLQVQGAQQANQLNTLQMEKYQRENSQQNALADLYKNAYSADGKLDRSALLRGAASGGLGARIPDLQKGFAAEDKATAETEKAKLESHLKNFEVAGQIMSGVKDQASWDAARAQTAQVFGQEAAARLPAQYDPALVEQNRIKAMSVKDQMEQQYKALTFQETKDNNLRVDARTVRGQDMTAKTAAAGQAITMRGQNLTDARSREANQSGKVPPGYRAMPDGSLQAIPGGPADLKTNAAGVQKVSDAKDVLSLLNEVDDLLPKATGSYTGVGVDAVAGGLGYSTEGSKATAQLKALQGALVAKMPKMSGPQSDKDVLLYREMAGQVGDPTIPRDQRKAAADMVRKLNEKYAGMPEGSSKVGATAPAAPQGSWADDKEARYQEWKAKQAKASQ